MSAPFAKFKYHSQDFMWRLRCDILDYWTTLHGAAGREQGLALLRGLKYNSESDNPVDGELRQIKALQAGSVDTFNHVKCHNSDRRSQ